MSHSTCTHQNRVDSWLLVVRNQTANFTPSPSFGHNLSCKCSNGSYEAILDIYTSRPFQRYKEHLDVLTPAIALWIFGSPKGLPSPIFGNVNGDVITPSKWGCNKTIKEFHTRPAKKKRHRVWWGHHLSFSGAGCHIKCTTSNHKWNKGLKTYKRLYHKNYV